MVQRIQRGHSRKTAIEMARKFEAQLLIVNVLEDFGDAAKVWKKHDLIVREVEKEPTHF